MKITPHTGTPAVHNRCVHSDLSAVGGLTSLFQRGSLAGIRSVTGTRKAFANITISRSETPRSPVSMCETVDRPISKPRTQQRAARSSCVSPPSFRSRQTCLPTMLRTFPSSIVKLAYRKGSRPGVGWWYASRLFLIANSPEITNLRFVMPAAATILAATDPASSRRRSWNVGIYQNPVLNPWIGGATQPGRQVPSCFRSIPVEYFRKQTAFRSEVTPKSLRIS